MRGRSLSRSVKRAGLPIRNPDPEFLLRHHHGGWITDEAGELLPVLHQVYLQPGVDLIDMTGDSQHNQTNGAREGFVYLTDEDATEDDTPDRQPGFIRAWDTLVGRPHHTTAWQHVTILPGDELVWKSEQGSYRTWLANLVRRGRIARPSVETVLNLIEQLEAQVATLLSYSKPTGDAEAARVKQRIVRLREQLEELESNDGADARRPAATRPPQGKPVKAKEVA
jgi:hypothetical protein